MGETKSPDDTVKKKRFLGRLRRFARNDDGATAVEFGLIMVPFIALIFAIIETSIVFFTQQALQTAVTDASRLILTGQAQSNKDGAGNPQPFDANRFKQEICNRFPLSIGSTSPCTDRILLDVRSFSSFGSANPASLPPVGSADPLDHKYQQGQPGEVVIVRVGLIHPVLLQFMMFNLTNYGTNQMLLQAAAAFRNEPFPPP